MESEHSTSFTLPIRHYVAVLALVTFGLVATHLGLNWYNYQIEEVPWLLLQLFELDEENNLPTWFSGFLLLNNAVVLVLAAGQATQHRVQWLILAAGFLLLSIDEIAGLHETFHTAIDSNWTIYAAILVAVVALSFIPFLIALPRRIAIWFVFAGGVYLSGALLVEWLSRDMDEETLAYSIAVATEEGLEMIGALVFFALNLQRLKGLNPTITIEFD